MAIKLDRDNINLCPLGTFNSIEQFVLDLGYSKSWAKKYLTRKELDKKAGDVLSLPLCLLNKNQINPQYHGPSCDILFEDDRFIIMDKPANVHGHPLDYQDQKNLLSFLRSQGKGSLLEVNDQKQERGLLYRLDYETSGVLVYVKDTELFFKLFENRESRIVEKTYLALVEGEIEESNILVDKLLGSDKKGSVVKVDESGKRAELSYTRKSYSAEKNLSLVKVVLKTGLRHQIRVQLANHGFPLVGDEKYGGKKSSRLFLHAYEYTVDLTELDGGGGQLKFQSIVPDQFQIK